MKPIRILSASLVTLLWPLTASALTEPHEAPAAASTSIHTVSAGDSLDKIARANGCTAADLAAANKLRLDDILQLGQQLVVPGTALSKASQEQLITPSPREEAPSHTIKQGETFTLIAKQYAVTIESLMAANPTVKATALRPGQKILLPKTISARQKTEASEEIQKEAQPIQAPASDENTEASATDDLEAAESPFPIKRTARTIATDREMTYGELAALYGTETDRLNSLNGLDLPPSAIVVKGADLLVPMRATP